MMPNPTHENTAFAEHAAPRAALVFTVLTDIDKVFYRASGRKAKAQCAHGLPAVF